MGTVRVLGMYEPVPPGFVGVDTTSKSGQWSGLSPFLLGPVLLYPGACPAVGDRAHNVENAWQFAKLYADHADARGNPTDAYWEWARQGWGDRRAHRYPMGKGAVPLCSWWNGQKLGYIEARKAIYGPLYARSVRQTPAYAALEQLVRTDDVALRDYDGYDHDKRGWSLSQVLANPTKKMGHAFVLKMLLLRDPALGELGV